MDIDVTRAVAGGSDKTSAPMPVANVRRGVGKTKATMRLAVPLDAVCVDLDPQTSFAPADHYDVVIMDTPEFPGGGTDAETMRELYKQLTEDGSANDL